MVVHRRSVHDRQILRLALPALGALAVEPLYVLVDTAIVGHLGTDPLGGLAVAGAVLVAVFNIFNFLAYSTTAAVRVAWASATGRPRPDEHAEANREPHARHALLDPQARALALDVLWVVAALQPLNAAVFVLDGVLIGAGDAPYLAAAMAAASFLGVRARGRARARQVPDVAVGRDLPVHDGATRRERASLRRRRVAGDGRRAQRLTPA